MIDFVFIVLLFSVLLYELVAIVNNQIGDTISERNWDARDYSWWSRVLVDTVVVWAFYHLFIDDEFFVRGVSWVDLVVVVIAVTLSLWTWRRKERT